MELMEKENLWKNISLGTVTLNISSGKSSTKNTNGEFPIYGSTGIIGSSMKFDYHGRNILVARVGANAGKTNLVDGKYCVSDNTLIVSPNDRLDANFCFHQLCFIDLNRLVFGSGQPLITGSILKNIDFPLPPTLEEQKVIATALSDVDELITNLDKLITKKKGLKQGAMQQLLTPPHKGGKRLEGFSGEWLYLTIEQVADCLDNLRVPLNGEQRNKMQGDIPYCGANGVVDFVNDFVIDDDIILIAEDGGYFDEYKTRPIAYRMTGKCWVNNHAHILKSKKGYSQGFLYFSLVHKNILDYINGGTRAKLNKGEMSKIECWFPNKYEEQKAISEILSDMDFEIEQLESKKTKYQSLKQGMMQELLTGKTRLV